MKIVGLPRMAWIGCFLVSFGVSASEIAPDELQATVNAYKPGVRKILSTYHWDCLLRPNESLEVLFALTGGAIADDVKLEEESGSPRISAYLRGTLDGAKGGLVLAPVSAETVMSATAPAYQIPAENIYQRWVISRLFRPGSAQLMNSAFWEAAANHIAGTVEAWKGKAVSRECLAALLDGAVLSYIAVNVAERTYYGKKTPAHRREFMRDLARLPILQLMGGDVETPSLQLENPARYLPNFVQP